MNSPKDKLSKLRKEKSISREEFSSLAREIVEFYYNEGNQQINLINSLIYAAHETHGINTQKLIAWLEPLIPHELIDNTTPKKFGKKNRKKQKTSYEEQLKKFPRYYSIKLSPKQSSDTILIKKVIAITQDIDFKKIRLSKTEILALEKLSHDINLAVVINKSRGNLTHISDAPNATFVAGGLPSLGKKKK